MILLMHSRRVGNCVGAVESGETGVISSRVWIIDMFMRVHRVTYFVCVGVVIYVSIIGVNVAGDV